MQLAWLVRRGGGAGEEEVRERSGEEGEGRGGQIAQLLLFNVCRAHGVCRSGGA